MQEKQQKTRMIEGSVRYENELADFGIQIFKLSVKTVILLINMPENILCRVFTLI